MACAEKPKMVIIHKADKYENNFVQVDKEALGDAAGLLKLCGLKLYIYLVGNQNGFNFSLSPLAFGRWMNMDYCPNNDDKMDESIRASVNKIIRDGLKDLVENGFAKKLNDLTYEFFEKQIVIQETNCHSDNKLLPKEQIVTQETKSYPENKLLSEEQKVTQLEKTFADLF